MTDPTPLSRVDKDLFDRTWATVKELGEREKHFNDLQSRYRTLASTWLLAAFAGIGFVFTKTVAAPVASHLIAIVISWAGAVGIVLLWVLDVLVYHDLIIAGYVVGKRLEELYPWLPPVRTNFSALTRGHAVRWYIAAFYLSGISVLCGLAATIAYLWSGPRSVSFVISLALWLGLGLLISAWTSGALRRKRNLPQWPQPSSIADQGMTEEARNDTANKTMPFGRVRFSGAGTPIYLLICTALASWGTSRLLADETLIAAATIVLGILGMWVFAVFFRLRAVIRSVRERCSTHLSEGGPL